MKYVAFLVPPCHGTRDGRGYLGFCSHLRHHGFQLEKMSKFRECLHHKLAHLFALLIEPETIVLEQGSDSARGVQCVKPMSLVSGFLGGLQGGGGGGCVLGPVELDPLCL